jgi:hypothetical protein
MNLAVRTGLTFGAGAAAPWVVLAVVDIDLVIDEDS